MRRDGLTTAGRVEYESDKEELDRAESHLPVHLQQWKIFLDNHIFETTFNVFIFETSYKRRTTDLMAIVTPMIKMNAGKIKSAKCNPSHSA